MTTPMLAVQQSGEPLVLYGSGARFVADADGIVNLRPIDKSAVTVRLPRRATSLQMQGGETLSITVAAGDVIEIV